MNYFEFYPGDYLRDTTRLSFAEHGAYLRLLLAYFGEEKSLPEPYSKLYVITGAVSASDKAAIRNIADRYFPVAEDGERHNGRADAEIEKAQKRMSASRENGSKGGRPKKPSNNPAGNPPGFEMGGFQEPRNNPSVTQPGEALQTPQANLPTDRSTQTPASPPDRVGTFEGHETAPAAKPNPAAALAVALNRAGVQVTSLNPELIEAEREGVTAAALVELTTLDEFKGKPATYVIRAARRMHAEKATTIAIGAKNAQPSPRRESLVERAARLAVEEERARRSIGQDDDRSLVSDGDDVRPPLEHDVR